MRLAAAAFMLVLAAASPAAAAPNASGRLEFDVVRNGQPFGRHVVTVSGAGGNFSVQSRADLRANVGPVTVFRYEHACSETWEQGRLAGLSCNTLRDGRRTRVIARREGGGLVVSGAEGQTSFDLSAIPTSWWTKPPTTIDHMIDAETGARMPISVTRVGRETLTIGGQSVQAERIRVRGTLAVDLWYDMNGRWVGCEFSTRGQRIQYRLTTPLSAAPA
jgi:hypothetical protein